MHVKYKRMHFIDTICNEMAPHFAHKPRIILEDGKLDSENCDLPSSESQGALE